jgi:hypothetical protein
MCAHCQMTKTYRGGGKLREGDQVGSVTQKKIAKSPTRIMPVGTISTPRNILDPVQPNTASWLGTPPKPQAKDRTMYLERDQTTNDQGIKLLTNACANNTQFVVIVGKKYGSFPWSLGYRPPHEGLVGDDGDNGSYAVLGWYRVKAYWCEYEPGRAGVDGVPLFVRWKFLFEWVAEQGVPWWLQRPLVQTDPATAVDVGDSIVGSDESLSKATDSAPLPQCRFTTGTFSLRNSFVFQN